MPRDDSPTPSIQENPAYNNGVVLGNAIATQQYRAQQSSTVVDIAKEQGVLDNNYGYL